MGKIYYCDYCDRSFKDDVEARKKHLSSLQHAQNRANHYNNFKDADTILKEEFVKSPCKRHMISKDCAFGSGCRFSHYTPQMLWILKQFVAMKNFKESVPPNGWPNSEDIIKEYFENVTDSSDTEDINYPAWSTSSQLADCSNLPPSLWPITAENMINSSFNKWG